MLVKLPPGGIFNRFFKLLIGGPIGSGADDTKIRSAKQKKIL